MNDEHIPVDVPADDELLARMRAALDEAAAVDPATPVPAEHPSLDRRRWIAIAAAAVLVIGGVAAAAVNLSGDGTTPATLPLPGPETVLTGVATIIDDGDGPQLAATVLASLPPQGGEIPLANFEWDIVDGEETLNGTTWSSMVQVTGRWDGTAFTIDRPPTTPAPVALPPADNTPTPGCAEATAQAARDAVAALDWQSLHFSSWNPTTTGGKCGAEVTAWFDTQEVRDALDAIRAEGHEVSVTYLFNPIDDPTPPPSTVPGSAPSTTVASGSDGDWYEVTAPGLTAQPVEFTGCCLPVPAPGPDVVMVWTDDAGGVFMLQATGHADGSPADLTFASHGLTPERAKELEARVVPGSGLPYVLDDPAMELVGQGFDGAGRTTSQRYTPTEGNGDALLTVGDYTGQLGALAGPWQVDDTTVAGQAAVRYATNAYTVFVWLTPQRQWAELKVAAALADRADEIAASLVLTTAPVNPNPRIDPSGSPTTSSTAPTTGPSTTTAVDSVPPGWMFRLDAPDLGFAVEVVLDAAPPGGWGFTGLDPNPLTSTAAHPVMITAYADPTSRVSTEPLTPWPLGTRLEWHDRVGGNASFVVTGIATDAGATLDGTRDGHVLVIDVQGVGDAHWTAFATRAPEVVGRFFFTGSIRMPNEDVWGTKQPDAPMYSLSGSMTSPLTEGRAALLASEHSDIGEALSFAMVGSTASWQALDGATQDLVVVATTDGPTPDVPPNTVLIVQAPRADGGTIQLCLAPAP